MADSSPVTPGFVGQIDQAIADWFSQWNIASTIIAGLMLIVLIYPLFTGREPDIHPFLLARQANQSPIRQEGESATYRSTEIPYGYPMRSGLAIKDPGASKWTTGRDGDLRDVWRQAVNGSSKDDGSSIKATAKIITILGVEKTIEHDIRGLTSEINVIGKYLKDVGSKRVAVNLTNSAELICTIFAGAFYGWSPVLLPYSQSQESTKELLGAGEFDTVIAEAGSVSLETLASKNGRVKRVIWVTKPASSHLDWNEVPEGTGGKIEVTTWSDLVDEHKSQATNEVLPLDKENEALPLCTYWPDRSGKYRLVEYTQKNVVAGMAALQSSLPRAQKLSSADYVLSTMSLSASYSLCWSLLALFTGSTLILNSVAGPTANILTVTNSERQRIKATHIISDARSVSRLVRDLTETSGKSGLSAKYNSWTIRRGIAQGYFPDSKPSYLPSALKNLKVLYIAQEDVAEKSARITSETLCKVRILSGSRVSLALTSAQVAGPVSQTNIFDYRDKGKECCIGAASASLELNLTGPEDEMKKLDGVGSIMVKGPAVVGKDKTMIDLQARVDADNTLIVI